MATTPKQNSAAAVPAADNMNLTPDALKAIAVKIASRDGKWGKEQASVFLALIARKLGVADPIVAALCAAAEWHGAVVNCSAFAQWADGEAGLGLATKLRGERAAAQAALASRLAGYE